MRINLQSLIEYTIFPALILVLGKFFGLLLALIIFSIEIIEYKKSILVDIPVISHSDSAIVSTFSDIFMFSAISGYVIFTIIRVTYFSKNKITPSRIRQLFESKLTFLITTTYEVYHTCLTTIIFMWFATLMILINSVIGNTEIWVFIVCFLTSAGVTVLLIRDIKLELGNNEKII